MGALVWGHQVYSTQAGVCLGVYAVHAIPTLCNWAADRLHGDGAGPRG